LKNGTYGLKQNPCIIFLLQEYHGIIFSKDSTIIFSVKTIDAFSNYIFYEPVV